MSNKVSADCIFISSCFDVGQLIYLVEDGLCSLLYHKIIY